MDSKLQLFAKVLLKEHYDEFLEMIQLFNIDKRTFVLQHRKMFEKGWYDTSSEDNEFSEVDIMLCFAIVSHRMAVIDWSGEEYSGQVKRSITMMLKNYGIERFLWNTKKFEDSLDWDKIRRGDYLPLLFQAMNKQLNRGGYSIVFCDTKITMPGNQLYTKLCNKYVANFTSLMRRENQQIQLMLILCYPVI